MTEMKNTQTGKMRPSIYLSKILEDVDNNRGATSLSFRLAQIVERYEAASSRQVPLEAWQCVAIRKAISSEKIDENFIRNLGQKLIDRADDDLRLESVGAEVMKLSMADRVALLEQIEL